MAISDCVFSPARQSSFMILYLTSKGGQKEVFREVHEVFCWFEGLYRFGAPQNIINNKKKARQGLPALAGIRGHEPPVQ